MANHVGGSLRHEGLSEEGQKVWDEYVVKFLEDNKTPNDYEVHLGHYLFKCDKTTGEFTDWDFNKMCEEIGAKWAYATDWDEMYVSVYSAWSPVLEWVEKVAIKVGEADPNAQFIFTYEDEFPNFIGVATFDKEGMDTDNVLEVDDLHHICRDLYEDLNALWDPETEEWTDEEAAYEILIQFGFPNASPVTVATKASSNNSNDRSVAFVTFLPLIVLPKK